MRPTRNVQFALAERIAHLDAAAWNELTHDASVFMQAPFLTALEQALPANVSPRYALMYRGEEAIAALCMQLVRVEGRAAVAASVPLSGLTQLLDERALVLGSLVGWGDTGLVMRPGADADLVWREAMRLMDRLRRFEKSEGVVNVSFIKDAVTEAHELTLRQQGYQLAPSGADMQLTLEPGWKSLDDYLASLSSNPRRAVKKTLQQLEAGGYRARELNVAELEANEARLDALYGQVWANADVRPLRLSGKFFVELKRRLPDSCAMFGLEKDGQLDAFGVCLESQDVCVGYYLGYDKSVEAPLYLRLLISVIEQAIAWRSASASMGRTSEEPKARLGAVAGPSSLWVKHRVPPLNWAVGAVLGTLEEAAVPTHRVFRQS
ncbi:MAG: GNAT family N-acetyltransferase [Archangium sp.]|nr:GNAT family N-acetyltransferase [Archangium sp.]MDP3153757.1 GNAT family N-acetyltransferase [Archangium sp.]MDP3575684.1 GNAT family N-acetyltransferase [Archangium sp.]